MAEFGSRLASLAAHPSFVAGHPSLAALLQARDALASYPLPGVNVHAQPDLSQAWLQEQTIEPVPFGSFADPVSQLAFLMAPGVLRGLKGTLDAAAAPGPGLRGLLASERGNLGPPPVGPRGEPLPGSVVRDAEGRLQRLYHGTNKVYPDFEMGKADPGGLYGPGIYTTDTVDVAQGYAIQDWPKEAREVLQRLQRLRESKSAYEQAAAEAAQRGAPEARQWMQEASRYEGLMRDQEALMSEAGQYFPSVFERPANIRPVYADLKNPFDMEGRLNEAAVRKLLGQSPGTEYESVDNMLSGWFQRPPGSRATHELSMSGHDTYNLLVQRGFGGDKNAANAFLAEQGYDGITHMGGAVTGGQPHRVYISFSPDTVYPSFNVDALRPR